MNNFRFIPDQEHFDKIRLTALGASDFTILLGLSKYMSPYGKWRIMTGKDRPPEAGKAASWGHRHEMNILSSYIEEITCADTAYLFEMDYLKRKYKRPRRYNPPTEFLPYTEFFHPEIPWLMAHPDCIDLDREENIEAKSGRLYANIRRPGMDGYDYNDHGPSGVPLKVYVQTQIQMLCTGLKMTRVRALIDTSDVHTYEIPASKKVQEKLLDIGSRFMWNVKNNKEPMPINTADIKKMFPEVINKTAYVMGEQAEFARRMKERKKFLTSKVKRFKEEIEDINDGLFVMIGRNKYLFDDDNNKIATQVQFDIEKISGVKEIKETEKNLYIRLKSCGLIKPGKTRYVR